MINEEKFARIEARLERMADERRMRHDRYNVRVSQSKQMRGYAVWHALPEYQAMSLAQLLAHGDDELRDAGVDCAMLRRAALEKHMADEELVGNRQSDAEFVALSQLVTNLRKYVGAPL